MHKMQRKISAYQEKQKRLETTDFVKILEKYYVLQTHDHKPRSGNSWN